MEPSLLLKVIRSLAEREAQRRDQPQLAAEYLLLVLCKVEDSAVQRRITDDMRLGQADLDRAEAEIAALLQIFRQIGLDPVRVRRSLRARMPPAVPGSARPTRPPQAAAVRAIFAQAERLARQDGSQQISAAHLLAAIGANPTPLIADLLRANGVTADDLNRFVGKRAYETTIGQAGAITYRTRTLDAPFAEITPESGDAAARVIDRLRALYTICREIAEAGSGALPFPAIARALLTAIPAAQHAAIYILDANDTLTLQAGLPAEQRAISYSWAERALRKREAFIWSALQPPTDTSPTADARSAVRNAIYAPLIFAQIAFGVLYVDSCDQERSFAIDDLELARTVATQVAITLHNHQLQREQQRLGVLKTHLRRHVGPDLIAQLIEPASRPGGASPWSTQGAVLAVLPCPPADLAADERRQQHYELHLTIAEQLIAAGASICRGTYTEPIIAVFHPLQWREETPRAALAGAWELWRRPQRPGWGLSIGLDVGAITQRLTAATPAPPDEFSHLEEGLRAARVAFGVRHASSDELLTLEHRLTENISRCRIYGDTPTFSSERAMIIAQLNRLLITHLGRSFLEICPAARGATPAAVATEYHVVGAPVDTAVALAHAPRCALLLSPAIHRLVATHYTGEPAAGINAYVVRGLHQGTA